MWNYREVLNAPYGRLDSGRRTLVMQLHVRDGTRNIGIIEKNLQELEGKLQYETNKLQGYSADLKEAEKRCNV